LQHTFGRNGPGHSLNQHVFVLVGAAVALPRRFSELGRSHGASLAAALANLSAIAGVISIHFLIDMFMASGIAPRL
jgi:hypothetical protein